MVRRGLRHPYGASSSATNAVFAVVLGLLAFLFLISVTLVLCAEINVVRVDRLYPRALLTVFTDDVELTPADRRTYARKARAEQAKGFQRVHVSFDKDPGPAATIKNRRRVAD